MFLPELPSFTTAQLVRLLAVVALLILPNFFAIWHSFHRQFPTVNEKMLWFLAAVFVPVLGGIAYIVFGRKRGRKPS